MRANYRDAALFFQDEDNIIGTSFMPYVQNVAGLTGVNYRSEPYKYREETGCSLGKMFQPCTADKPEDPVTPIIEAHAGDPVRIHVFGANNEQNQMFSVEKHEWPIEPFMRGADQISVVEFSGSETIDAFIPSAGGVYRLAGRLCVEQPAVAVLAIRAVGIFACPAGGRSAALAAERCGGRRQKGRRGRPFGGESHPGGRKVSL